MGLEFARQLAESGYRVMMVSNREAELQDAAKAITADFGVQAEALCIDLASEGSAESVLGWCDSLGLEVDVEYGSVAVDDEFRFRDTHID